MLQARQASPPGPPYFSYSIALMGGRPTVNEDIPACAVLLLIYSVAAVASQSIFQRNRGKGHKFYMSWAMFGFSMARVGTMVLRIAWTTRSTNARLAIAANIFTNIGVLVIYIVLLLLVMRVLRATHPSLGWNKHLRKTVLVSYVLLGMALILTIAFTILTFYTLNPTLRTAALWIQRVSILYMLIFNIATMVLLLLSWLLPRAQDRENFGTGSIESKLIILGLSVFFSVFIAGFRMGVAWSDARLATNPPWYDSKAAFYVIEFGFEIIVLYLLLLTRFDKRFWVPNGSNKPGDYSQNDLGGSTTRTSEQDIAAEPEKIAEHDDGLEKEVRLERGETFEKVEEEEKEVRLERGETFEKVEEEEKEKMSEGSETTEKHRVSDH